MTRKATMWFGWALALIVIAFFVRLGFWQLDRAVEKQAMLDAADQVLAERAAKPLAAAADPARAQAYDWAAGRGEFADRGPLWLDNQQRGGQVGVRAYRIFRPQSGAPPLLVDLGWLPLPGDRSLPAIERPPGTRQLRGLLSPPPSSGLTLGPGLVEKKGGWLLTRVESGAITAAAGLSTPLAPRVLRLDPDLALGYERDLELLPNTLPPIKHRGYALQWFAMALAVLVIALLLSFRKGKA